MGSTLVHIQLLVPVPGSPLLQEKKGDLGGGAGLLLGVGVEVGGGVSTMCFQLAGDVRSLCLKAKVAPRRRGAEPLHAGGGSRDAERLTACWSHASQTSLHYGCKDEFKNTQECELFSPPPLALREATSAATESRAENKERSCFEFVLGCKHHDTSTAIRHKNIKRVPLAPYEWWSN